MRNNVLVLMLVSLAGCPVPDPYRCEQSRDCQRGEVQGVCGADLTCSYPDETDGRDVEVPIDGPEANPRNVCLEGPAMGPHPDACVTTVCAINPACCALGWDRACVQQVETSCERGPAHSCSGMAVFPSPGGIIGVPSDGATSILFEIPLTEVNYAAVADHDGDGDGDLAYVGETGWGVRTATPQGWVDAGSQSGIAQFHGAHVTWADYDRDGDLDLFVSARLGIGAGPSRLVRNDAGTFVALSPLVTGDDILTADWGDLDGDGDLDLITGDVLNGNRLRVHRNDLTDGFTTTALPTPTFVGADGLRLCQLAGSPRPELVTAGRNFLRIYANGADGFLPTPLLAVNPVAPAEAFRTETHCADFDGDGDLDVLVGGWAGTKTEIYRNNGGVFPSTPAWSWDQLAGMTFDIGDLDGDGRLDLVVAQEQSNPLALRNTTAGPTAAITFGAGIGLADRDPAHHRGIELAPRP